MKCLKYIADIYSFIFVFADHQRHVHTPVGRVLPSTAEAVRVQMCGTNWSLADGLVAAQPTVEHFGGVGLSQFYGHWLSGAGP